MKKYKVIKTYPECKFKIGDILEWKENYYRSGNWNFYQSPSEFPEYFEEVIEKDYEILELRGKHNLTSRTVRKLNKQTGLYYLVDSNTKELSSDRLLSSGYGIYSIKYNKNNEIFTIGDSIKFSNDYCSFIIENIEYENKNILFYGNNNFCTLGISNIVKIKPLFTTEDGVEIFEDDKWFIVYVPGYTGTRSLYKVYESSESKLPIWLHDKSIKRFSTKEAAENFVLLNKPCLSIKEVLDNYACTTYNTERLEKLVKSKL